MEIPYGKVLIYTLTFLAYAYSGYGAGILASLRDAVLAAENVFGDVMKNVISVARRFESLNDVFDAAVEEHCVFKCPTGVPPKPNRNHVPTADGCGSLGVKIDSKYLPVGEMKKCCDVHDICYDTCNNDKEMCDIEFKRCLYKYCDTYKNSLGEGTVKACKGAAKVLFTGTLTLGCKSYLDAQKNACYCPPGKQKKGGGYGWAEDDSGAKEAPPSYGWKKEYKNSKYSKKEEF